MTKGTLTAPQGSEVSIHPWNTYYRGLQITEIHRNIV